MKKIYGILYLGILFSATTLRAQLNGVYTIDNTAPSSATNFTSFTQFASTLNAQGVSGPVTVNVGLGSGPYSEQIEIIQYAGASATNSVVINGNGRTITFNATNTALRHTIMLSGADYMTWNNLRVIGTNATSALVVHLWNGADNNKFNNMYIEAPFNGTSTTQVPFSISGSSVAATTAGNAGNGNVVNTCTIIGGYYNTVFCGNSISPVNVNNEVRNSILRDFYNIGFYNLYCLNSKAIGNTVDRVSRTTVTTTYGLYLSTGSIANGLIEGNMIRNLFTGIPGSTSTTYGIYIITDATSIAPNIVRNNVVSDINTNGILYGIFLSGADFAYAEHNTISLDDGSNTGGATYGIAATGVSDRVRNNNITIGRSGSGAKYGLFYTAAVNLVSDYNNVYISSTSGTNYFGSYTNNYNTLSTWTAGTGFDLNSVSADPQYASPGFFDYSLTNTAVNNKGLPIGLLYDILGIARSPLAPDPGAYESFNSVCTTTPPSNSFLVPSASVCPGMQIELTLQNTKNYTNSGYVVQWYTSNSGTIGTFLAIPGATLNSYVTNPVTSNIHFQAVITCAITNHSISTLPEAILVVPPVQDTVPYYEGFEALAQNQLPNCYWTATSFKTGTGTGTAPASGNRAAHTGSNYAYFANKPSTNYFYSNQILLKSGVTYSAALWYITENVGFSPWPDLSILIGTGQNPTGLQPIASASPVTGQLYNLLSSTFTVPATGYYNVAIRATGAQGAAPYLTWDDLSITIPCALNSPTLSVLAPTVQVCQGVPATLLAIGANSYSWSNGTQGPVNIVSPVTNSTYIVYGTNTLSGCSSSQTINLAITSAPKVSAIASKYTVCSGESMTLTATGADSYYWSTGSTNSVSVISPTVSTIYAVAGTNAAGCTGSAQVIVQVQAAPSINANTSSTLICRGTSVQLFAQGAQSYVWTAPNLYSTASQVTVTPQSSTMFTVTGTTQQNCSATAQVLVVVEACTGLAEIAGNDFHIFPNPVTDRLFIQTDGSNATITITDVSGRMIATQLSASELTAIDVANFSAGVYYVRVQSANYNRTEKFIIK